MIILNKKEFTVGTIMALGFFGLLFVIVSPVFNGRNGLEFADDMFNKLSKGSAYFIPKVEAHNQDFMGKQFAVTIIPDQPEDAERIAKLLTGSGEMVVPKEGSLDIKGDLGRMLAAVIKDSDAMYKNDGAQLASTYGYEEKQVMKDWWQALDKMNKELQLNKAFEEAKMIGDVMKKVVEPAYNFYKIEAVKVSERALSMTGILMFYVIYTVWWGFAIMYIFEGLGITTKRAKAKKEL